jgi:predicted RNase H-like nuclease (RuvC/YqgF family)
MTELTSLEQLNLDVANMSFAIENLKAALDASEKAVCDRDRQITELNREIETISKIAATFEEMLAKSDRKIEILECSERARSRMLAKSDRKIEILEDNLDRARSEHLEQLRAVTQMLQPLIGRPCNSTEEKDGKTYVYVNFSNEFTHNEKNSAIKLIQEVIYANIKRLDPIARYFDPW